MASTKQMSMRPSKGFGVSRGGVPITQAVAGETVRTGISYQTDIAGLVSSYEEYDAMIEAHYTESEWSELTGTAKARAVAHYRLKRLIALHENDAVSKRMKQLAKRKN